jgi:hypothetical protein
VLGDPAPEEKGEAAQALLAVASSFTVDARSLLNDQARCGAANILVPRPGAFLQSRGRPARPSPGGRSSRSRSLSSYRTSTAEMLGDPALGAPLEAAAAPPGQLGRWAQWRLERRRSL